MASFWRRRCHKELQSMASKVALNSRKITTTGHLQVCPHTMNLPKTENMVNTLLSQTKFCLVFSNLLLLTITGKSAQEYASEQTLRDSYWTDNTMVLRGLLPPFLKTRITVKRNCSGGTSSVFRRSTIKFKEACWKFICLCNLTLLEKPQVLSNVCFCGCVWHILPWVPKVLGNETQGDRRNFCTKCSDHLARRQFWEWSS